MQQENNELPVNITASSLKSFRRYSDIEDFYRFVFENDIRSEAFFMLNQYLETKKASKKTK